MVRLRPLVLLIAAAVLLGACQIDATISVGVNDDGSGTIRVRVALDADAVAALEAGGSPLEPGVRLDDLADAGWRITPWVRGGDGRAVLEIRRPFDSPESFERIIADLNGDDGPLRSARLRRSTDAIRTRFGFEAIADIAGSTAGVTADEELLDRLTAERVDVAALEQSLTDQVREALTLRVEVKLPGASTRTWTVAPDTRQALSAISTVVDLGRVLLLVTGVLAIAVALALVAVTSRRARLSRLRS